MSINKTLRNIADLLPQAPRVNSGKIVETKKRMLGFDFLSHDEKFKVNGIVSAYGDFKGFMDAFAKGAFRSDDKRWAHLRKKLNDFEHDIKDSKKEKIILWQMYIIDIPVEANHFKEMKSLYKSGGMDAVTAYVNKVKQYNSGRK